MIEHSSLSDRLLNVLEAEYAALVGGDIDQIEALGEEKLHVLEAIVDRPRRELKKVEHLRSKLVRNQILGQKAIEGMRMAINRAKEIERVTTQFSTYRANGRLSSVEVKLGETLSKRS